MINLGGKLENRNPKTLENNQSEMITTTMMISDLPGDLLEEILCRVPATSMNQLRSTCRRWNSLFNDSSFRRKHFDKATKQFGVLMLKESRVCSVSVNLHGIPSVEVTSELSLIDPCFSLDQFEIFHVSHCDGLLLCTNLFRTRLVVWNPCTGQTKWIQTTNPCVYTLGSYQDNKSNHNSYKILSYSRFDYNYPEFEIYEINSNSWRALDVTRDCKLKYPESSVYLKGKTYWFASDEKEKQLGIFLVNFDFTTERFGRVGLPYHCPRYETVSLSAVREEKLSVLLQRKNTSRTEIWVTNKIGLTKVVSWSMILAVDLNPQLYISDDISFLIDEEKKVILCCDKYLGNDEFVGKDMVYIVGEDNKVQQVDFGVSLSWPFLFNYVPSLTQIQQSVGGKRKREMNF